MNAFQFLDTFKIIFFGAFFLTFMILWMLKRRESAIAAGETAALLLLSASIKPIHFLLKLMGRFFALFAGVILHGAEIISVFSRVFYRIVLSSIMASLNHLKTRWIPAPYIGLAFFMVAAMISLIVQMPEPNAHDEFGYLLQADTFARGRLTNPTHPLWRHFESFHIIQKPSYTAKYPPAQGLFLAIGQVLTGHAIAGVWLTFALMMAALYWALKPFFPPGWALLGTVFAGLRTGVVGQPYLANGFGYWSQSYWGGAVAALGGALIFGSARRLWDKPSGHHSLLLGLGLAILANSRPYEGLLAAFPLAVFLLFWLLRDKRFSGRVKVFRVVAPLSAMLVLTFSWMAYYNWRVTGDPWKTPYEVHEATYGMPPIFIGQETRPKAEFIHSIQKDYYAGYVQKLYAYHSTLKGFIDLTLFRIKQTWIFFLGVFLLVPLLFLKKRDFFQDLWPSFFGITLLSMVLGELPVERLAFPHYVAPVAFPIYFFVTLGLVRLRDWRFENRRLGGIAVCFILILSLGEMAIPFKYRNEMPFCAWHRDRARLLRELRSTPGRHLVIVRYSADHSFHNEWIYNGADIDGSKVVWAREMSPEENGELRRYFSDRRQWLLEADKQRPKLVAYQEGEPAA